MVIFSNGYRRDNGDSVLYILNPLTGERIVDGSGDIGKIVTNSGPFNGMSNPRAIDINNDLKVDYVYAGDLQGNMWKFDLFLDPKQYDNSITTKQRIARNWQVAFCDNGTDAEHCQRDRPGMIPKPLFSAALKQPITGGPDIMRHQTRKGYMVIFGTGRYLGWTDLTNIDQQSLYGIWDWAPDYYDQGYLGSRTDNVVGGVKHVELSNWTQIDALGAPVHTLLEQTILYEGVISEDADGDGFTMVAEEDTNNNGVLDPSEDIDGDGKWDANEDVNGNGALDVYSYYRIPTFHEGDWSTLRNTQLVAAGYDPLTYTGSEEFDVPIANMGWVFDLPGKIEATGERALGERMVNDTIIRDGRAIMVTFGLSKDKCGASRYSFVNERDANTGGMVFTPIFDINGDRVVDDNDYIMIPDPNDPSAPPIFGVTTDKGGDGRMSNPVVGIGNEGTGGDGEGKIERKYFSSSAIDGTGGSGATIETVDEVAERRGMYYWKQIQ